MATMKTMATVKCYENKCVTNYSIITNNKWNDVNNNMQLTKHDTNDDVDTLHTHFNGRVAYMHWDCTRIFVPQLDDDTAHLMAQVLSAFIVTHGHIHGRTSLTRFSPSASSSSSCLSPSSSSTSSCSLSSTTRSSWQTCAAPLQKRVRTPWTPSPLSQPVTSLIRHGTPSTQEDEEPSESPPSQRKQAQYPLKQSGLRLAALKLSSPRLWDPHEITQNTKRAHRPLPGACSCFIKKKTNSQYTIHANAFARICRISRTHMYG